jgi:hypothetical protein
MVQENICGSGVDSTKFFYKGKGKWKMVGMKKE